MQASRSPNAARAEVQQQRLPVADGQPRAILVRTRLVAAEVDDAAREQRRHLLGARQARALLEQERLVRAARQAERRVPAPPVPATRPCGRRGGVDALISRAPYGSTKLGSAGSGTS